MVGHIQATSRFTTATERLCLVPPNKSVRYALVAHFQDPKISFKKHVFGKAILRAYAIMPTGDLIVEFQDEVKLEIIGDHSGNED